ncbi:unannotated protein [freshwater metagenome]|uniref:Unannotated protein n=1 Tax=freshwater metagenome TaxID=449393 RepID=A0A6J7B1R6_9ZZZZ
MIWRIQKTPKAVTSAGTIRPSRESISRRFLTNIKSGIIPSWLGNIIVPTTKRMKDLRPLKFNFAKAKPATAENITCAKAIAIPTMKVFNKALLKNTPSALITFLATIRKRPPGIRDGGLFEISAFVLDDTTNIQ